MRPKSITLVFIAFIAGMLISFGCGGSSEPEPGPEPEQPYITGISKTSSTTAGTTSISVYITFDKDISGFDFPTITVGEVAQASVSAAVSESETADCQADEAGTTVTCTVEIQNCTELQDYQISVAGMNDADGNPVSAIFNSADDEFDDEDSLSTAGNRTEASMRRRP